MAVLLAILQHLVPLGNLLCAMQLYLLAHLCRRSTHQEVLLQHGASPRVYVTVL